MTERLPETSDASAFTLPLSDLPRVRVYVRLFDDAVDSAVDRFDEQTGFVHHDMPAGSPGAEEWVADLDPEERKAHIGPLNEWAGGLARATANVICACGLAYAQPLSRHHRDSRMFDAVRSGLDAFARIQLPTGEWGLTPLRYATIWGSHEMGWQLENVLTAYFCVRDRLPPEDRERFWGMLGRAMEFLLATPCDHPNNRGMVWLATMAMCQRATGDDRFRRAADDIWRYIRDHVFHSSGMVKEGVGPCSNYSPVSYEYLARYRLMTGDRKLDPTLLRATDWMLEMYTDETAPFLGVSTRFEQLEGGAETTCLLPGLELFADERPWYRDSVEAILRKVQERYSGSILKNGGIGWLSAAAAHRDVAEAPAPRPAYIGRYTDQATDYSTFGGEAYQTMIAYRSLPPKKGLQTWAVRGAPAFLFPGGNVPSTVRAWGFDLASCDVTVWDPVRTDRGGDVHSLSARHGEMLVTYLLAPHTTIIVQTLPRPTPRETVWRGGEVETGSYYIDGPRVRAHGAPGALHWCGPRPEIADDGLTIAFRDDAATQVYALAVGEFNFGDGLTEDGAQEPTGLVHVAWHDNLGHYSATINHATEAAVAHVPNPVGKGKESVELAPGASRVVLVK